jgi:flagellar basal-body rod protein FlgF
MDRISTLLASGMRSRQEALDMLANNMANGSTAGFKAERERYRLYESEDAIWNNDAKQGVSLSPDIENNWIDFRQGDLQVTGNSEDFALQGSGFFTVETPQGPLYTRSGNFAAGILRTKDGYEVKLRPLIPTQPDGKVRFNPRLPLEMNQQGQLTQNKQAMASFELTDFASVHDLKKKAGVYFHFQPPADNAAAGKKPAGAEVRQGQLEASNGSQPEAAVKLVTIMRQFEMLNRAMTMQGEIGKRLTEEVGKPAA